MRTNLLLGIMLFALGTPACALTYNIDSVHSSVGFKIRHMVVAKTTGKFNDFSGSIHYEPPCGSRVSFFVCGRLAGERASPRLSPSRA